MERLAFRRGHTLICGLSIYSVRHGEYNLQKRARIDGKSEGRGYDNCLTSTAN